MSSNQSLFLLKGSGGARILVRGRTVPRQNDVTRLRTGSEEAAPTKGMLAKFKISKRNEPLKDETLFPKTRRFVALKNSIPEGGIVKILKKF